MPVKETPLTTEVFDQLRQAMEADPAGLTELYREYLTDAWQSLHLLRESVQQRQGEAVGAKAHYLKSSSLVLGARGVARYAARLEEAAKDLEPKEAGRLLRQMQQALREVQTDLSKRLGPGVVPARTRAA